MNNASLPVMPSALTKQNLHPRNRHRDRYDFAALIHASPALARYVRNNEHGDDSIDFARPDAVKALNQALLKHHYGLEEWDLPEGYLCPPIPGRADYIHYLADMLADGSDIPSGKEIRVLDIGVGANAIYPIIGVIEYGWQFVGTDIDVAALKNCRRIIAAHPLLSQNIELRLQHSARHCLTGVIKQGETFHLTMCNPPFHKSMSEVIAASRQKISGLSRSKATTDTRNFAGHPTELCCAGGEQAFIRRMIFESAQFPQLSLWFTSLVSKSSHLPVLRRILHTVGANKVNIVKMSQGQKQSRFIAWSFQSGERS